MTTNNNFGGNPAIKVGLINHTKTRNQEIPAIWVDLQDESIKNAHGIARKLANFYGVYIGEKLDIEDLTIYACHDIPAQYVNDNGEFIELDEDLWTTIEYGWREGISKLDIDKMNQLLDWANCTCHYVCDWRAFEEERV